MPISSGVFLPVVVPSPSWPQELPPQAQTRSAVPAMASADAPPLATWVTPVNPGTGAGLATFVPVAPLPSWPRLFRPQLNNVPSERTAKLGPAATTCVIPVRPGTCTGRDRSVVLPSPSDPSALSPHAQTVPCDLRPST